MTELTDEEIRVKVAKCLGWNCVRLNKIPALLIFQWEGTDPDGNRFERLPNYPASLDAAAEFEKGLTERERGEYVRAIKRGHVGSQYDGWAECEVFLGITAPARQRCLAFLKVKGAI